MIIEGKYLDEILRKLYGELTKSTDTFEASKGKGQDLLAPKVILKNPRARISATANRGRLISALGEFCWYMSGSADLEFVRFYIPNYPPVEAVGSLEDAYGPRLMGTGEFGHSIRQLELATERLRKKPDTRRAVVAIVDAQDFQEGQAEAPCTLALQFIRRRRSLHTVAMMRSNDAYMGFIHDVFCFTMIQELVARSLGVQVGEYHHFATSLHLYERNLNEVSKYLDEGYQNPTFAMPKMPSGCQKKNLFAFLETEKAIRGGVLTKASEINLPVYWRDLALVILRQADWRYRRGNSALEENFSHVSDPFYKNFFQKKPIPLKKKNAIETKQETLDLGETNER